ncbi:hypothetical protein Tco_0895078 [Tanacetum coccineum]|uniref:Uncharacterized protein n=1 Tax=Tanacetum coccineum TaxID=301880 RepID=A0ABQ5CH11_9ASTR
MLGRKMLLVGDKTENVPLVEYWANYNDEDEPIPFRRRVFPSSLDGKHIAGKNVEDLIKGKSFSKLDNDDAVSLCCIYFTYENVNPNKEDRGHQLAIMNLGHQFDNAITAKDEMRKAYEECRDIPLMQRALIENFMKKESELGQQMQNALFRKAAKLENQIRDKNKWLQQL